MWTGGKYTSSKKHKTVLKLNLKLTGSFPQWAKSYETSSFCIRICLLPAPQVCCCGEERSVLIVSLSNTAHTAQGDKGPAWLENLWSVTKDTTPSSPQGWCFLPGNKKLCTVPPCEQASLHRSGEQTGISDRWVNWGMDLAGSCISGLKDNGL